MNGRQLSNGLFRDAILPTLRERFPEDVDAVAAAAVGEGSDVLGYDDAISWDHNSGPRVAVFLADDRFDDIGDQLFDTLKAALPTHYAGVPLTWTQWSPALRVLPLHRYHAQALDRTDLPSSELDWLRCDEQTLLELTAGAIFHDPSGSLEAIRRRLAHYPPAVRHFLLRICFARMSEVAGVERSIRRGDWIATNHCVAFFVHFAIRAAHLLARCYCPYHKWMAHSLRQIGPWEAALHQRLERLVRTRSLSSVRDEMLHVLTDLGTRVTEELESRPPGVPVDDDMVLLPFEWAAVLGPLSDRIPDSLRRLSPLVSPSSYFGSIFDYSGYGGTFRDLLKANLEHQGRAE